jgi:hypothetical protein
VTFLGFFGAVLAKRGKNGAKFQQTPFLKKSLRILFAIQNCLIIINPAKSIHPIGHPFHGVACHKEVCSES